MQGPDQASIFWIEQATARDEGASCPPFSGSTRCDVCIVGGGFVGLWTAIELKQRDPATDVMLIDAVFCGHGASGRNGGWVTGWHDELDALLRRFGEDQALFLASASSQAISRIHDFADEHGIRCHFERAGAFWVATAPAQLGAWGAAIAACRMYGRADLLHNVDAAEARARTGCELIVGAAFQSDAAKVHPGLLVRGLRRVALELGVRIHEGTSMRAVSRTVRAIVETDYGVITAASVVLALGGWTPSVVSELRRAVIPVPSHVLVTEPMPERVAGVGWTGGELLSDARQLVHYAQVTRDGRIAFGQGGGVLGFGGDVVPRHHFDGDAIRRLHDDFCRFWPALADARVTHAWGGPVDRAPLHLPFAGRLGGGNIVYATGFSGNGVGPSRVLADVLASLVTNTDDEWSRCGLTGGPPAYLPPEPFRFLGGTIVQEAVRRAEEAEEAGAVPDPISRRLRKLASFRMPDAIERRIHR